jgi:hypothetical protein
MSRGVSLVVTLLAVTAGCSGAFGGGTQASVTETVTPVPVTSERATGTASPTATPRSLDYPAGVGPDGVTSTYALRNEHLAAVDDRSFTLVMRGVMPDQDGGLQRVNRTYLAATDSILVRVGGDEQRERTYVTENRTYYRRHNASSGRWTTREGLSRTTPVGWRVRTARRPLEYVSTTMNETAVVERDDRRFLRLFSTEAPTSFENSPGVEEVRNYTATAYVTPEGLVRTVVLAFDLAGNSQRATLRISLHRVGETTVERPAWTKAAQSRGERAGAGNETTANGTATR